MLLPTLADAEEARFTPIVAFKTQYAQTSIGGVDPAWEADLDVGFRWRPASDWTVVANIEARQAITDTHFADIVGASGSLVGVADGTGGGPLLRLEKFWVRRDFAGGALTFGRLHFEDHFLDNALSSKSAVAFTNEAFSGKASTPFPRDAMGAVLNLDINERVSLSVVVGDAGRNAEFDLFASGEVFAAAQAEFRWAPWGLGQGRYRLGVWGRSVENGVSFGEGGGVGVSIEQPLSAHVVLMLRAHHGDDRLQRVENELAAAVGFTPAARPEDQFGVGVAWLDPSDPSREDQPVGEIYYRWQVLEHLALTPTLQWTGSGAGINRVDDSVFWGLRLRYRS